VAFIGEVVELRHFMRHSFLVRTRQGKEVNVIFYPEANPPVPGFCVGSIKVVDTLVILNAERKMFMDMTEGIRVEHMPACWAFKAPLVDLTDEVAKLMINADAKSCSGRTSFTCYGCN
jgi:hypothetical protein